MQVLHFKTQKSRMPLLSKHWNEICNQILDRLVIYCLLHSDMCHIICSKCTEVVT